MKYILTIILFCSICYAQEEVEVEKKPVPKKQIQKSTKRRPSPRGHKFKFRNIDSDGDREISLDEFVEFRKLLIEKEFDRVDRNLDGVINRKEFLQMKKKMKSQQKKSQRR